MYSAFTWPSWRTVATSGWRGRSFSLGVADSVTVLAPTAALADAAATLIANAVEWAYQARVSDVVNDRCTMSPPGWLDGLAGGRD